MQLTKHGTQDNADITARNRPIFDCIAFGGQLYARAKKTRKNGLKNVCKLEITKTHSRGDCFGYVCKTKWVSVKCALHIMPRTYKVNLTNYCFTLYKMLIHFTLAQIC